MFQYSFRQWAQFKFFTRCPMEICNHSSISSLPSFSEFETIPSTIDPRPPTHSWRSFGAATYAAGALHSWKIPIWDEFDWLLSLFLCSIGGPWCCLSLKRGRMCHCISRWNAGKDGRTQHSNPVEAKICERNWCPESWEGRHCHPSVFFVQDEQSESQHLISWGWTRGSRSIILILLILIILIIISIISISSAQQLISLRCDRPKQKMV